MRRLVLLLIVAVACAAAFAVWKGYLPAVGDMIRQLASQPDVRERFANGRDGRFDATVLLFTVLILTPIVAVGVAIGLTVVVVMLEGTVMEVGRRIGLPDTVMLVVMVAALVGVAYAKAPLWVPGSLKFLGIVARAYLVATA